MGCMTLTYHAFNPVRSELLECIRADGLEHVKAKLAPTGLTAGKETPVDECQKAGQQRTVIRGKVATDRFGSTQRKPSLKHRKAHRQRQQRCRKQAVAPGGNVAQGLLPWGKICGAL